MTVDRLAGLQNGYEALWLGRDVDAATAGLSEDFEWISPEQLSDVRRGRDGLRQFFSDWLESFPDGRAEWALEQLDEHHVLATVRLSGSGAGSGALVDFEFFQLWVFEGPVARRCIVARSLPSALEAAGLSGP